MRTILACLTGAVLLWIPVEAQPRPAIEQLHGVLERIANTPDSVTIPAPESLADRVAALPSASVADVNYILPTARACLLSSNPVVKKHGLAVLIGVALRADSASLLSGLLSDLAPMLDDLDAGIRTGAMFVMSTLHPHSPYVVLQYLTPRLMDASRSVAEVLNLAGGMLAVAPDDQTVIEQIVKVAKQRPQKELVGGVLQRLGSVKTTNEEALQFVDQSLSNSNREIRRDAVSSLIGRRPDVIRRFEARLRQIAEDPNEDRITRSIASQVRARARL